MYIKKAINFVVYALGGLLLGALFFLFSASAQAQVTATSSITVQIHVPAPAGAGPTDNPPSISAVTTTVSYTTAVLQWAVADDNGVRAVNFAYGLDQNYALAGAVGGSYQTSLSGLASSTRYYYKISVTDTGGHTTEYTDSFTTLSDAQDVTAPTIAAVAAAPSTTSAVVTWTTNENADSQIEYGLTNAYGNRQSNASFVLNHTVAIGGLTPNTTYHYRVISSDAAGNYSATGDFTFKTAKTTVPPPNVTAVAVTQAGDGLLVTWNNPALNANPDFVTTIIVLRKIGGPSANSTDGTQVYSGSGQAVNDKAISTNVTYYYTVFAIDVSGNSSSGAYASGKLDQKVTPEICTNNIDDDGNGLTDCADAACALDAACKKKPDVTPEICGNGIDDDANGLTDCADSACVGYKECAVVVPDNKYQPPESTVASGAQVPLSGLLFFMSHRQIAVTLGSNTLTGLAGTDFTVAIPQASLYDSPKTITLVIDGTARYQFTLSKTDGRYYSDNTIPQVGAHRAFVEIEYESGKFDSVSFAIQSLPLGTVTADNAAVAKALVSLYTEGGALMATDKFGRSNPQESSANGLYGWSVPNGKYFIKVSKDGYYDRTTPVFAVTNFAVNIPVEIIATPRKLLEDVSSTASLAENVGAITKNLVAGTAALGKRASQAVSDIKNNPAVTNATSNKVVPAVVSATAIGTAALVSWADLLPFLRLLFLQPLMLLGLRRRSKWGQVYNTLNKLPVDLATVRLIDSATGRVVQSKVTDQKGRYAFIAPPGRYSLSVTKNNFTFPSKLMVGVTSDGTRTDIYHGEEIAVNEKDAAITANVPLDPVGEDTKPVRIVWQQFWRTVQVMLSWLGFVVTLVSLYIAPRWYVALLLGIHVLLLLVFKRLAIPPKVKSWGIVYDATNKNPVGRTVARLFNAEFNKLVATQITDKYGRYYFLAGDNKYYVTYDHPAYTPQKTDLIDVSGKESENISPDVSLTPPAVKPPQTSTLAENAPNQTVTPPDPPKDKSNV